MIKFIFAPVFLRQVKKLDQKLAEEVWEKLELFRDLKNHKLLKVHKLHGELLSYSGFSVNYNTRIIFQHISKNEVAMLAVGNHDIYKN